MSEAVRHIFISALNHLDGARLSAAPYDSRAQLLEMAKAIQANPEITWSTGRFSRITVRLEPDVSWVQSSMLFEKQRILRVYVRPVTVEPRDSSLEPALRKNLLFTTRPKNFLQYGLGFITPRALEPRPGDWGQIVITAGRLELAGVFVPSFSSLDAQQRFGYSDIAQRFRDDLDLYRDEAWKRFDEIARSMGARYFSQIPPTGTIPALQYAREYLRPGERLGWARPLGLIVLDENGAAMTKQAWVPQDLSALLSGGARLSSAPRQAMDLWANLHQGPDFLRKLAFVGAELSREAETQEIAPYGNPSLDMARIILDLSDSARPHPSIVGKAFPRPAPADVIKVMREAIATQKFSKQKDLEPGVDFKALLDADYPSLAALREAFERWLAGEARADLPAEIFALVDKMRDDDRVDNLKGWKFPDQNRIAEDTSTWLKRGDILTDGSLLGTSRIFYVVTAVSPARVTAIAWDHVARTTREISIRPLMERGSIGYPLFYVADGPEAEALISLLQRALPGGARLAVVDSLSEAVDALSEIASLSPSAYHDTADRIVFGLAVENARSAVLDIRRTLRARGAFYDTPDLFPRFLRQETEQTFLRIFSIMKAYPPPIRDHEAALQVARLFHRALIAITDFGRASFPGFEGARLAEDDEDESYAGGYGHFSSMLRLDAGLFRHGLVGTDGREVSEADAYARIASHLLEHLASNAYDAVSLRGASEKGFVPRIRQRAYVDDAGNLHLTVQDNGVGADRSTVEKIFTDIIQSQKRAAGIPLYGGKGEALLITRMYAAEFGGRIVFETKTADPESGLRKIFDTATGETGIEEVPGLEQGTRVEVVLPPKKGRLPVAKEILDMSWPKAAARLASPASPEEAAQALRMVQWKAVTDRPIVPSEADPHEAEERVEEFRRYAEDSISGFDGANWRGLDFSRAMEAQEALSEGRALRITIVPYEFKRTQRWLGGMALFSLDGKLVAHGFYSCDQIEAAPIGERKGSVAPAFGVHPEFQGKVPSGEIYEGFLRVLEALFEPEFYKVQVTQIINRQPGSDEGRTIFYLRHGFVPPHFVTDSVPGKADDLYLRMTEGQRVGREDVRPVIDAMFDMAGRYVPESPDALWSSPRLGGDPEKDETTALTQGTRLSADYRRVLADEMREKTAFLNERVFGPLTTERDAADIMEVWTGTADMTQLKGVRANVVFVNKGGLFDGWWDAQKEIAEIRDLSLDSLIVYELPAAIGPQIFGNHYRRVNAQGRPAFGHYNPDHILLGIDFDLYPGAVIYLPASFSAEEIAGWQRRFDEAGLRVTFRGRPAPRETFPVNPELYYHETQIMSLAEMHRDLERVLRQRGIKRDEMLFNRLLGVALAGTGISPDDPKALPYVRLVNESMRPLYDVSLFTDFLKRQPGGARLAEMTAADKRNLEEARRLAAEILAESGTPTIAAVVGRSALQSGKLSEAKLWRIPAEKRREAGLVESASGRMTKDRQIELLHAKIDILNSAAAKVKTELEAMRDGRPAIDEGLRRLLQDSRELSHPLWAKITAHLDDSKKLSADQVWKALSTKGDDKAASAREEVERLRVLHGTVREGSGSTVRTARVQRPSATKPPAPRVIPPSKPEPPPHPAEPVVADEDYAERVREAARESIAFVEGGNVTVEFSPAFIRLQSLAAEHAAKPPVAAALDESFFVFIAAARTHIDATAAAPVSDEAKTREAKTRLYRAERLLGLSLWLLENGHLRVSRRDDGAAGLSKAYNLIAKWYTDRTRQTVQGRGAELERGGDLFIAAQSLLVSAEAAIRGSARTHAAHALRPEDLHHVVVRRNDFVTMCVWGHKPIAGERVLRGTLDIIRGHSEEEADYVLSGLNGLIRFYLQRHLYKKAGELVGLGRVIADEFRLLIERNGPNFFRIEAEYVDLTSGRPLPPRPDAARLAGDEGKRLAGIFSKPSGARLSGSEAASLSRPNRDLVKILAAVTAEGAPTVFDYSFRENGRFENARLAFEREKGGVRVSFLDREEEKWVPYHSQVVPENDLASARSLWKRRMDARAQYRLGLRLLSSRAAALAKADKKDEIALSKSMAALAAAGALSAERPVVFLVGGKISPLMASQFGRILRERDAGNPAYARLHFVFEDPTLRSDDLSALSDPSSMKLVYWGDARTATAAAVLRMAGPVLDRFAPRDARVGFAPLEAPVFLEKGKEPCYRVAGIVLANAVTQRLDLRSETLGLVKARLFDLYGEAAGRSLDDGRFTLENLGALQLFDESRRPIYAFFAAQPAGIDYDVALRYAELQRQAETAA